MTAERWQPEVLQVEDNPEAWLELVMERGWGDGLPVIPPTPDRVEEFLAHSARDPDETIGRLPPLGAEATPRSIAVNAIMAGCRPEYMPVVEAAIEATAQPIHNLYGLQATTNPCGTLVVVHGPIAKELKMNAGLGALGPGWRPNATIGRAVRLILMNVGGAKPWEFDRSTQGSPMKYTFCTAENVDESPWEPLHAARGFKAEDSAVSVSAVQGIHNIIDLTGKTAREALAVLAEGMSAFVTNNHTLGGDPWLAMCPETAAIIAGDGFSRRDIQLFLFENARVRMDKAPQALRDFLPPRRPKWIDREAYPIADTPDDIHFFVVGGPGVHSQYLPTFGNTRAVTVKVRSRAQR